ncbi:MAG: hypothetical protein IT442_08470 [Phycisphaeraceae bacterium]|nr:hypothetical protein [Phycisphaeraceae bacterium]
MSAESLKITALTPAQAAKVLAATYGRRITEEQVRQVVEDAQLLRADGTFSLIEYTAFLAGEATRGID